MTCYNTEGETSLLVEVSSVMVHNYRISIFMKYFRSLCVIASIILISAPGAIFAATLSYVPMAPLAQTKAPQLVTEKSATLVGWVNPNQTSGTTYWFEWGIGGQQTYYETKRMSAGTAKEYTFSLTGLAPERGYFYRVVAENTRGKDVGMTTSFVTKALPVVLEPTIAVVTLEPKAVTDISANLNGYIAAHGSKTAVRWFEWGTTQALGNITKSARAASGVSYFNTTINGLVPDTQYYYRAIGDNDSGPMFGIIRSFRTLEGPAIGAVTSGTSGSGGTRTTTATTKTHSAGLLVEDPSQITSTSASVPVTTILSGTERAVARMEYGPDATVLTRRGTQWAVQKGEYTKNVPLSGLNPDTKYYYRMVIESESGKKTYSEQHTFTTAIKSTSQLSFFGNKSPTKSGATAVGGNTSGSSTIVGNPMTPGIVQGKTPLSGGSFSGFMNALFGGKSVTHQIATISENVAQDPVQYTIRYANGGTETLTQAVLRVEFPKNVIYVGDDTQNEFAVVGEEVSVKREYVLEVGDISPGETRTVTLLGLQTSDVITDTGARSTLEYVDANGKTQVLSGEAVTYAKIEELNARDGMTPAGEGAVKSSTSPIKTILWWVFYIFALFGAIFGFVKGKRYYEKRKKILELNGKKEQIIPRL